MNDKPRFHFCFLNWGPWTTVRTNRYAVSYPWTRPGCYAHLKQTITQERHCLVCEKTQLRTEETDLT